MISRTLCFASSGRLSLRLCQLVWDGADGVQKTIPVEDIGFVILESEKIEITSAALQFLADANVAVVICDKAHMPAAQTLSYSAHTTTAETVKAQLSASDAVNGRLWKKICSAKIDNQATLMERLGYGNYRRLKTLASKVKNGDPQNCEAQAARIYFQTLGPEGFTRDRDGTWPNNALNYGYAILRAATARALVGSGLLCIKGIHHHNRYNNFALADDVMEPYRVFVDQYIFGKVRPFDVPSIELTREMKARLLQMLTCDVSLGEYKRPLMIALTYTSASLAKYYKGETNTLLLPKIT